MAGRKKVLETGEWKAGVNDAVHAAPELRDVRGLCWADNPGLKEEVEDIWRTYQRVISRPVLDLPLPQVSDAFKKMQAQTVKFRRDLVHNELLSADSNERRLKRAAAIGALIPGYGAEESDENPLRRLDAAQQEVAEQLHRTDMALGKLIAAQNELNAGLQKAESTDYTNAELRDFARPRIAEAFSAAGILATSSQTGVLVLVLMQLEQRDSEDGTEDAKQRRYLSSDLSKLLRTLQNLS